MPGPTIETDKIIPEREDTHDKTFGLQEELNRIFKEENKSKPKKTTSAKKISVKKAKTEVKKHKSTKKVSKK